MYAKHKMVQVHGYEKDLIRLFSDIEVSVHFMFHYFQKVYKCQCPFHVELIPQ